MPLSAIYRATFWRRASPNRIAVRLLASILEWQDRANQRHQLRTMPDYMLKDIGLTRADVDGEASKPFWMR